MFTKSITDTEIFIYFNGSLIYKKWRLTDQPSKLFNDHWPNVDIIKEDN